MKGFFTFNLILFSIVSIVLVLGCSSDSGNGDTTNNPDPDDPIAVNNPPTAQNQTFSASESLALARTSIGFIDAEDPDGDNLSFSIAPDAGFFIDTITGELITVVGSPLDYETAASVSFNVTISDNNGGATTITITIEIIDEPDGFLTDFQKAFLDEYEYVTYNFSPTSSGPDRSVKWGQEVNLFLDGAITDAYRNSVQQYLNDFNVLFSDGVTIKLVDTLEASNVHLILGNTNAVQDVWPDMFNLINGAGFGGYALYNFDGSVQIIKGRIWVNTSGEAIFKHEMGHIMGLGHSSGPYCSFNNGAVSFMCSSTAAEFTAFDAGILKTLYSPNITTGKTFGELEPIIEQLLIEGSITL